MAVNTSHIDVASYVVIVVTFVLFAAAVWMKGLTHDLLLEAGVFLVSVKLILMNAKSNTATQALDTRLRAIEATLDRLAGTSSR